MRCYVPDPAGGANSAPRPPVWILRRRKEGVKRGKGKEREARGEERERDRK